MDKSVFTAEIAKLKETFGDAKFGDLRVRHLWDKFQHCETRFFQRIVENSIIQAKEPNWVTEWSKSKELEADRSKSDSQSFDSWIKEVRVEEKSFFSKEEIAENFKLMRMLFVNNDMNKVLAEGGHSASSIAAEAREYAKMVRRTLFQNKVIKCIQCDDSGICEAEAIDFPHTSPTPFRCNCESGKKNPTLPQWTDRHRRSFRLESR